MKRLSVEEMNKILLEKIPLEERLRAVYLPIIAMDCACYLAEDLLAALRELRLENTKKVSRAIRGCIEGYRKDNLHAMRSDLYRSLSESTKDCYQWLSRDMTIYQLQYQQALLDRNLRFGLEAEKLVATAYVIRELVGLVLELDRSFSEGISDLLGKEINYVTEDNRYCLDMRKALNELFKVLNVPDDLRTVQTDMALKVFRNRLNSISI